MAHGLFEINIITVIFEIKIEPVFCWNDNYFWPKQNHAVDEIPPILSFFSLSNLTREMIWQPVRHRLFVGPRFNELAIFQNSKIQPGVRNFSALDYCICKVCGNQRCIRKTCSTKHCFFQPCGTKIRAIQDCSVEKCTCQVRFMQISSIEFRPPASDARKICVAKYRAGQVGIVQIGVCQICTTQIRTRKVEACQNGTFEERVSKVRPPVVSLLEFRCSTHRVAQEAYILQSLLKIMWKGGILGFTLVDYFPGFGVFTDEITKKIQHKKISIIRVARRQFSQYINAGQTDGQFIAFEHLSASLKSVDHQSHFGQQVLFVGSTSLLVRRPRAPTGERQSDQRQKQKAKIPEDDGSIKIAVARAPIFLGPLNVTCAKQQQDETEANKAKDDARDQCFRCPKTGFRLCRQFGRSVRRIGFVHRCRAQNRFNNRFIKPERARLCNWKAAA